MTACALHLVSVQPWLSLEAAEEERREPGVADDRVGRVRCSTRAASRGACT
jgi:hypothetical protein